ncbi:integrase [Cereibacter sphaeroides]|nr:integrase [Cereibacter sphaeroides]AZB58887.1 integrase [Cereibacter sphaeroides]
MPRPSKGARLYLVTRTGRSPVWVIRDGACEISTRTGHRGEAETALAAYIADRDQRARPRSCLAADEMTVAHALTLYGEEHGPTVADPQRIGYAIEALMTFWGNLRVAAIRGETCRTYARQRGRAPGTIRRELGTLQAALNHCVREGHLLSAPKVTLPEKPKARERWLTQEEAYWLLRAARNLRRDGRHLAWFIVAGLYTGTRKTALLGLRINQPGTDAGWVDTERGVLYRAGSGKRETNKRQPSVRLPRQLRALLAAGARSGRRFVVQTSEGNRVADIKKAWAGAVVKAAEMAAKAGREIDLSDTTPHVLRHTAITWAMQRGADMWEAGGFFGVSRETMEEVYAHHHPDHQASAVEAMERRRK